jgi:hypothetical protein
MVISGEPGSGAAGVFLGDPSALRMHVPLQNLA